VLKEKKNLRKTPIFTNLTKGFEHIELPAKLLDNFLQSNKSNIYQLYTPTCNGIQDTYLIYATINARNAMCTYTRASMPVRQCSNFFAVQTIAINLATWALPKKPSESTTAHGAVAAALSHWHRHHLIVCLAPSTLSMVCTRSLEIGLIHQKNLFPPLFSGAFDTKGVTVYLSRCWLSIKFIIVNHFFESFILLAEMVKA